VSGQREHGELASAVPDPVVVIGPTGELLWANPAAQATFGWSVDAMVGRSMIDLIHPDDVATAVTGLVAIVDQGGPGSLMELRIRNPSGAYQTAEVRGAPLGDGPFAGGAVVVARDITDRRRWELASGDANVLGSLLEHSPAVTMLLDRYGRVTGASRAVTRLLGREIEAALRRPLVDLVAEADRTSVSAELALVLAYGGSRTCEAYLQCADGRSVPFSLTVTNLLDDLTVEGILVTAVDITALVEARLKIKYQASHDAVTSLPNRYLILDRLSHALALARRRGTPVTVFFCDVDDLKAINDEHGHAVGDAVLAEIAHRLRGVCRSSDTVGRMSGDEFVVIVEEDSEGGVAELGQRIDAAFARPVVTGGGTQIDIRMSWGWARDDGHGGQEELLARADASMYAAKRAHKRDRSPATES